MVYRGKPSAGCENCRKAKKRCGLEQPSCARCVKLKKTCSGYRDVTQLQIQDESAAVRLKAERQKGRAAAAPAAASVTPPAPFAFVPAKTENGLATPAATTGPQSENSPKSETSSSSDDTIDIPIHSKNNQLTTFNDFADDDPEQHTEQKSQQGLGIPLTIKHNADEVGVTYFFKQFTADNGHWTFLRRYEKRSRLDPVLDLAIKACGIAALDNVQPLVMGREYSRSIYAQALSLLNGALRDPKRCRSDESLMAVLMLGYFENLTCDGRESIQSWKAHIQGAMQLLQLRGKNQFKSVVGQLLFREIRAQILIYTIWDDLDPPSFLRDWNQDLQFHSANIEVITPADELSLICFDFSRLRYRMRMQTITDEDAYNTINHIEMRMVQWSIDSMNTHQHWKYRDLEVQDSPHVWNGMVHAYEGHPAASVWETYRSVRIMVTRTQEVLLRRFGVPTEQQEAQVSYFKSVRRQMTDDICAAIPSQLGHAPGYNSPCILITAYGSIWPLFFAGTCALERIGPQIWTSLSDKNSTYSMSTATSSALAQALWIIGRLEYVSKDVGLRWADGIAATLKGDFEIAGDEDLLPIYGEADSGYIKMFWKQKMAEMRNNELPNWVEKVKSSGRGPKLLMERESPLSDALARPRERHGPIWVGGGRMANSSMAPPW
ncbi:hypothetical protein HII31_10638 [Pseudocercospora fuligena]|uniref:Zn(2)-C6 fungal-type domain-containing protein n=1 Tax=Pseudocercospora fuligena TaxID=685502 RepID=A0A8H6RBH2_9PEZI|nr:hypothetical protein HII31_10638 [Pseudocercospora fuligena]